MDFDKLVKEWFYRLPKGYADAPYSQEELAVLDEVMTEQGVSLPEAELEKEKFTEPDQMRMYKEVDQLDQAFHDAERVEELKWASLEELEEVLSEAPTQGWEQLQSIQEKISAVDKQREWDEFKSVIDASGALPAAATVKILNGLLHGQPRINKHNNNSNKQQLW